MGRNKWLSTLKMLSLTCAVAGFTGCASQEKTESSASAQNDNVTSQAVMTTEAVTQTEQSTEEEKEKTVREIVDPAKITYAESYKIEKIEANMNEKVECALTVEVENAEPAEGVKVVADDNCSGGSYVDISDNKAFSLTVNLPASQVYKISVCHKAGSHKENPIKFNGAKVCDVYSDEGDWIVSEYDGIFLNEGENVITIGDGWSWFSMDYITIENGSGQSDDIYNIEHKTLSNKYANLKTQNIYQYLQAVYGKRTLAGQCTDYGHNTETDALYNGLGKYPAVRTFDFIYDSVSHCGGEPSAKDAALAKEWSADGGLVVFDWHWYAPADGSAFYTKDTKFTIDKARTPDDMGLVDMDLEDIKTLYKNDQISLETVMLYIDLDNIATLLKDLENSDVTVLWRPLHEASGGWFWWGATGPDDYIWLWKTMYNRFTNFHCLDNLIWIWNAQDPEWYPGEEYCDIAALDVYGPAHDYGVSPSTFADVDSWVDGKLMVTMSECATMPDPELIVRDNTYWLWFAVWNWDYIVENGTPNLSEAYTEIDMMKKVYDSDVIITRDELPKF